MSSNDIERELRKTYPRLWDSYVSIIVAEVQEYMLSQQKFDSVQFEEVLGAAVMSHIIEQEVGDIVAYDDVEVWLELNLEASSVVLSVEENLRDYSTKINDIEPIPKNAFADGLHDYVYYNIQREYELIPRKKMTVCSQVTHGKAEVTLEFDYGLGGVFRTFVLDDGYGKYWGLRKAI